MASSIIEQTCTTCDIFQLSFSGGIRSTIENLSLIGDCSAVPTGGVAIDISPSTLTYGGSLYQHLTIKCMFEAIFDNSTNDSLSDILPSYIYSSVMIDLRGGGANLSAGQLDNVPSSAFGFENGNYYGYNPNSSVSVSRGDIAASNGYFFIATTSGSTAPLGSGLPLTPFLSNISDGSVTWQMIGNANLTLVYSGTENWLTNNDMTSPALYAVQCDGNVDCKENWIMNNDMGGEIGGGVIFKNGAENNHVTGNQFVDIGLAGASPNYGYPIWDQGGSASNNGGNHHGQYGWHGFPRWFFPLTAAVTGSFPATTSPHTTAANHYCAIYLYNNASGVSITGNVIVAEGSVGAICGAGSGDYNTATGNTVFGQAVSLPGLTV